MILMTVWYLRAAAARVWHVMRAVMPRWLLATFAVCLIIPGPFDELAAALVGAGFVIARWDRARAAWHDFTA